MSLPAMHGWTHRPKSLGGTDPVPMPTGIQYAIGFDGLVASRPTNAACAMQYLSWNDNVFGYAVTSGTSPNKKAKYILIPEGHYMLDYIVFWTGDFTPGDNPFIQPWYYAPSDASENVLAGSPFGVQGLDDAQGNVYSEQFTAAEMAHHELIATQYLTWTEADWGETSIGIGVALRVSGGITTRTWGCAISIVRLGDAVTLQTIA